MLGENPLRPQDLNFFDVFPPALKPPITKAFRILVDRASAHLEQAKRDQKAFADASRRPLEFSVGGLVRVSTRYIAARGCPKFQQRHIGPYRIFERIGPTAYKLQLPPSMPIHRVFHVSLLSAHRPRPQDMARPPEWELTGKASDGLTIYEVESIFDQQGEGDEARRSVFGSGSEYWHARPRASARYFEAIERTFGTATKANSFGTTVTHERTQEAIRRCRMRMVVLQSVMMRMSSVVSMAIRRAVVVH
ncbi:hypothetical protein Esti_005776 [Eimeria stiedai]